MDAVRVLLVVLCFASAGRGGVFDSDTVGDGGLVENRAAVVAGTKDRKVLHDGGAVVRAAQKEIGVCEAGENTGPKVDQYNTYVGLHQVAWCASFVSWCHGQAGYKEPRTAWSPALFPAGKLAKKAAPGMIIGIYYPHLKRIGHCGIVERTRNDLVYSIEGNTNANGGREGNGVYRKIRHKHTIHSYANWTEGGAR